MNALVLANEDLPIYLLMHYSDIYWIEHYIHYVVCYCNFIVIEQHEKHEELRDIFQTSVINSNLNLHKALWREITTL